MGEQVRVDCRHRVHTNYWRIQTSGKFERQGRQSRELDDVPEGLESCENLRSQARLLINLSTVSIRKLSRTVAKEYPSQEKLPTYSTVCARSSRSKTLVCRKLLKCNISTTRKHRASLTLIRI